MPAATVGLGRCWVAGWRLAHVYDNTAHAQPPTDIAFPLYRIVSCLHQHTLGNHRQPLLPVHTVRCACHTTRNVKRSAKKAARASAHGVPTAVAHTSRHYLLHSLQQLLQRVCPSPSLANGG